MMAPVADRSLELQTEDSSTVSAVHGQDTKRMYLGTYKRLIWASILALCVLVPAAAFIRSHGQHTTVDQSHHSAFISAPRNGFLTATPPKSRTAMNAHGKDDKSLLKQTLGQKLDRRSAMQAAFPAAVAAALTPAAALAAPPPQRQSMLPPKREKSGQIKTGNAGSIMKKR